MASIPWVAPLRPSRARWSLTPPIASLDAVQQLLKVPWGVVTDGCNLHRDTLDAIKDLPWRVKGKVVSDAVGMWITRPTAVGTATKT